MALSSVQDEVAKCVNPYFEPATGEVYLHAAGREDIDVRMLGSGRPFVFEFINPKKAISCHDSVKDIKVDTPYVRCHGLKIVDK